jgi:hypothetical protein
MQSPIMAMFLALVLVVAAQATATPLPPNGAPASAFGDCTSAFHAGESTARYFTSSAYNRLACNESEVDVTETVLANVVRSQGALTTSDSDERKRCYYGGFYTGYAEQAADEYADCGNRGRFRAVTRASLAIMAEAVFVHVAKLPLPADKAGAVTAVFTLDDTFVAPCDRACKADCDRELARRIATDVANADAEVVAALTALVCRVTA